MARIELFHVALVLMCAAFASAANNNDLTTLMPTCNADGLTTCQTYANITGGDFTLSVSASYAQCRTGLMFVECLKKAKDNCTTGARYLDTLENKIQPIENVYNKTCGIFPKCDTNAVSVCEGNEGGSITTILAGAVSERCTKGARLVDCLNNAFQSCEVEGIIRSGIKTALDGADTLVNLRCAACGLMPSLLVVLGVASLALMRMRD